MESLPVPPHESILYEDDRIYACLALYPLTKGHTVVVWKERAEDLHLLSRTDYEYLMDVVGMIRNALLTCLNLEKVYLIYMDEVKQVHWHLVPRYDEQGVNVLAHNPDMTDDFSLSPRLKEIIQRESK